MEEGKQPFESITAIARALGISAWDQLSAKQVANILKFAGQARISEHQIKKIIEISNGFAPIAASVFQALQTAGENAAECQRKFLENYSTAAQSTLESLKSLLEETRDEENKIRLAQMITDLAQEELVGLKEMARSNNLFWMIFAAIATSASAAGAFVLWNAI